MRSQPTSPIGAVSRYAVNGDGSLSLEDATAGIADDGATILFSWHGYARPAAVDRREIVGSITHLTGTERYAWLNNTVCAMVGEVRPRKAGESFEVVFEVAELAWEPLG
jgi:hypothetical protein